MKHASFTVTLALLLLSACKSAPNTDAASPGSSATSDRATPHLTQGTGFDYYLLNLSWSPEFCYSHPTPSSAHHTPLLCFMVYGRRTPTAVIPKIVLMPRAPPIHQPLATSIPIRACFNMNGIRMEPVPALAPTIS